MKKSSRIMVIAAMIALMALLGACGDDDNPTIVPTTGSVAGTVTFSGEWPSTGEVQVSIYSSLSPPWVPMGPPEAFTDPILGAPAQYNYKMEGLDKATYAAVYVSWRDPQNPAASRLLGMYWAFTDSVGINAQSGLPSVQPTSVTIDNAKLNHTGLDITVDLDLAP
ncbi:MAG: hypothetical protein ABIA59_00660 [Candidatus Latescibacterota bacterium]